MPNAQIRASSWTILRASRKASNWPPAP
jgi:hypothetical protein